MLYVKIVYSGILTPPPPPTLYGLLVITANFLSRKNGHTFSYQIKTPLMWSPVNTSSGHILKSQTVETFITSHFRVHLSLHFKARLSAKSLLRKSIFIHIEIGTNYHNKNIALTLALKVRLRETRKWPISLLEYCHSCYNQSTCDMLVLSIIVIYLVVKRPI